MPRGRPAHPARTQTVDDCRHADDKRTNIPEAGMAGVVQVPKRPPKQYEYDPHLDPQSVWAGKAEHASFEVPTVPLYVHERVSTEAVLQAVRRPEPLQLSFFGQEPLSIDQRLACYQHEMGWVNRLILSDSLVVMNSLLELEGMAGKVQTIYIDPPYGIKYSSNFQPRIDRRDVKDSDEDLTREPERSFRSAETSRRALLRKVNVVINRPRSRSR